MAGPDPRCIDAMALQLKAMSKGDVISTGAVLKEIRVAAPECPDTDEELVALIVNEATVRQMAVQFDHRP